MIRRFFRVIGDGLRDKELRPILVAVGGMFFIGTIVYTVVEGWSVLDSLYFSVVALTTVGFGDFTPQTAFGKAFTIVYILAGVGLLFAFVSWVLARAQEMGPRKRRFRRGPDSDHENEE